MNAYSSSTNFEHYEIIEEFDRKGIFAVFKGEERTTGKTVAIKCFNPLFSRISDIEKNVLRNYEVMQSFEHPAVVKVLNCVGRDKDKEGVPFIVMELLEGDTLGKLIEKNFSVSIRDAVKILIEVLEGLEAIHSFGFLHNDIRPGKIFIMKNVEYLNRVKLLSSGYVRLDLVNYSSENISDKMLWAERICCASPEYFTTGVLDRRSDIFSAGMVLVKMISLDYPFKAVNPDDLISLRIREKISPDSIEFREDVPPVLKSIVIKAIQQSPDQRYQTAREMLLDIADVEKDMELAEFPTSLYMPAHLRHIEEFTNDLEKEQETSPFLPGEYKEEEGSFSEVSYDIDIEAEMDNKMAPAQVEYGNEIEEIDETKSSTQKYHGKNREKIIFTVIASLVILLGAGLVLIIVIRLAIGKSQFPYSKERIFSTGEVVVTGVSGRWMEVQIESVLKNVLKDTVHISIKRVPDGAIVRLGNQLLQGDIFEANIHRSSKPVILEVEAPGYATFIKTVVPEKDIEITLDMAKISTEIPSSYSIVEGAGKRTETKVVKKRKIRKRKEKTIKGQMGTAISAEYGDY